MKWVQQQLRIQSIRRKAADVDTNHPVTSVTRSPPPTQTPIINTFRFEEDRSKQVVRLCDISQLHINHTFASSSFWHKLKFQLRKEPKIQPTQPNQRSPSGNQEKMFICGLSFKVTTKLLRVIIRPLTPPPPPQSYSCMIHTQALKTNKQCPMNTNIFSET